MKRLASSIIYCNPSLRADPAILIKNHRGQSALWSYSISGDLPILLLQIGDPANILLVNQLVQAHAYWRLKGLAVDLVIWNEDQGGYRQLLQDLILGLITASTGANLTDRPGGIFVRHIEQISQEDKVLLQTVARVIISDSKGTLTEQINLRRISKPPVPALIPTLTAGAITAAVVAEPEDLLFFNSLGGYANGGLEYKIVLEPGAATPAPWVNIIANPNFGTVISESGQSYTWVENAHEFRLTPWNNDPVSDSGGEAFYIRDEETGRYWSPTPLPARGTGTYTIRHGFGYSVYEYQEEGIQSELWVYVDISASIKFSVLKLKNISGRSRKLSATGYAELVLGDSRPKAVMHIVTELDITTGALLAKNPYHSSYSDRIVFFDVDNTERTFTGDRTEFIGRNGSLQQPDALSRIKLSGKLGAALDPCIAIQVACDLSSVQEKTVIFRLGTGRNMQDASNLVRQFRGFSEANNALEKVNNYWKQTLAAVKVETPNQSLNILANGWLIYQTICCRLWARSGFYQSGGAFGFRDQLQDVLAVLHTEPGLAREQILLCASRQFKEGDVQHWWHPPTGRGVRTRCSDDFLWLPFVAGKYVLSTGDMALLDQQVHFLEGSSTQSERGVLL
jgi:cellobiose phosphorylase